MNKLINQTKEISRKPGMSVRLFCLGAYVVGSLVFVLATLQSVHAAEFFCPSGDVTCLIAAITEANQNGEADTITLEAGTYTLTSVDNITDGANGLPSITSNITIQGASADTTIIAGNLSFRIFHVGVPGSLTLDGLAIRGGRPDPFFGAGGGIFNAGTVTISNSIVSGNRGGQASGGGGGIFNAGTATISNSVTSFNFAFVGGGISNVGTMTINDSTISHNGITLSGGGILNSGTLTLSNCAVTANAAIDGGGIDNQGTLLVANSTIMGNTAALIGGGIRNLGDLNVDSSTIAQNTAENQDQDSFTRGGGLFNGFPAGTATVTNSTVSGNAASAGLGSFTHGAGIDNEGLLFLKNSTITLNDLPLSAAAEALGSGINNFGTLNMQNTIVASNTFGGEQLGDITGTVASSGHNLIGNTMGSSGFDPTDLLDVDPLLGPLQDNGGPTLTHALLPGSPAIDSGDNTDAPEFDQRGDGFARIVNDVIDRGAFEVQEGEASSAWK